MDPSDLTLGTDPVRSYTPEEERRLTENLLAIAKHIRGGQLADRPPSTDLLLQLHHLLFRGVRDHAGRHRDRGFGQERLTFGPNRSSHRDHVAVELRRIFDRAARELRALREDGACVDYEKKAIGLAAHTHAEIIRTHPFEDGNGRTSRMMMSHILVALGMPPIPIEAAKDEYNQVLNKYFRTDDDSVLLDFFLRLYPFSPTNS